MSGAGDLLAGVPVLRGVLPLDRQRLLPDIVAGVTLAALAAVSQQPKVSPRAAPA